MDNWRRLKKKFRDGSTEEVKKEAAWLLKYMIRYRRQICGYLALGIAGTLTGLVSGVTSKYLIDAVTGYRRELLIRMMGLMTLTGIGGILLNGITNRVLTRISLKVSREMLCEVFQKILSTQWECMNRYRSGDLLSRLHTDISVVSGSILGWMPSLATKLVHFIGSLAVICYFDPVMGAIAMASAPVTAFASKALIGRMRTFTRKMRAASSDMMEFSQESFSQIQTIKAFHLSDVFMNRLDSVQKGYIDTTLEYNLFSVRTSLLMSLLSMGVSLVCIAWGAYGLWTGRITYGTMTLFLQTAKALEADFSALIRLVPAAVSAATSAGRIMDITELPKEDEGDRENIAAIEREGGLCVELSDVCFSYDEERRILDHIQFSLSPGELTGIRGHSGSGKTTLLRILLGLVRIDKGKAVIRSASGREEALGAGTRGFFSYVPQGNTIFSGTLADNLRMMKPEASDEELREALITACAWEFVEQLPGGMYSVIGERGLGLSEGQSQRIAIARAVLNRSRILLLDEATSALDQDTGRRVLENLRQRLPDTACILVSHKAEALKTCGRVYILDGNGNMREEKKS